MVLDSQWTRGKESTTSARDGWAEPTENPEKAETPAPWGIPWT